MLIVCCYVTICEMYLFCSFLKVGGHGSNFLDSLSQLLDYAGRLQSKWSSHVSVTLRSEDRKLFPTLFDSNRKFFSLDRARSHKDAWGYNKTWLALFCESKLLMYQTCMFNETFTSMICICGHEKLYYSKDLQSHMRIRRTDFNKVWYTLYQFFLSPGRLVIQVGYDRQSKKLLSCPPPRP